MQKELNRTTERIFEQRRKPRIQVSLPAVLQITNDDGRKLQSEAVVGNMSACGLYLLTNHFLLLGNKISVVIQLGDSFVNAEVEKTYLMIGGHVVRVDQKKDTQYGIAVEIRHYRFL